jgi:hypothetical protein
VYNPELDLSAWLHEQLDADESWASAAKGVRWRWVYSETDEVVQPDPVGHECLSVTDPDGDDIVTKMDLRSVEEKDAGYGPLPVAWPVHYAEEIDSASAGHIIRHDPAAVLADIAAKRAILGLHCTRSGTGGTWDTDPVAICNDCSDVQPCMTLRLIASAYSGRPGYRDEWRVDGFGGTGSCIE